MSDEDLPENANSPHLLKRRVAVAFRPSLTSASYTPGQEHAYTNTYTNLHRVYIHMCEREAWADSRLALARLWCKRFSEWTLKIDLPSHTLPFHRFALPSSSGSSDALRFLPFFLGVSFGWMQPHLSNMNLIVRIFAFHGNNDLCDFLIRINLNEQNSEKSIDSKKSYKYNI